MKQPLKFFFIAPLWKNNQILVAILGICRALAVTIKIGVPLTMALSVSFVTAFSSFFVSLVHKFTPDNVRMIAQLVIISSLFIVVDQFLKAYFYEMSKTLSIFVGLIITNCLLMGRAESMARRTLPIPAFLDGISAGIEYGYVIIAIGTIRELFGFGTLFGYQIISKSWYARANHPDRYVNFGLMSLAPAALFIIGVFIWITNIINKRRSST